MFQMNDKVYINFGPLCGHVGYIIKYHSIMDDYFVKVLNTNNSGLNTVECIKSTHLTFFKEDKIEVEGFSSDELENIFNK